MKAIRLAVIALGAVAAPAAFAQFTFSVVTASYSLQGGGVVNFSAFPNNTTGQIDFVPGNPAFKVGDSTGFPSGTAAIIYNVTSTVAVTGIDLIFQGQVFDFGHIEFTEFAEDSIGSLGSISGSVRGASFSGGANGSYTQTMTLNFSRPVFSFKVKKTFDMDISNQTLPSSSIASIGLIEQNMRTVPEPASMAALALGIGAIAARRRKRS